MEKVIEFIFVAYIMLLHIAFIRVLFYCADLYGEVHSNCSYCKCELKEAHNDR